MADDRGNQTVQLGCGTLILIAVIVSFFSRGSDSRDVEQEVRSLRSEVRELKQSVDAQTGEIKALRQALDKGKAKE